MLLDAMSRVVKRAIEVPSTLVDLLAFCLQELSPAYDTYKIPTEKTRNNPTFDLRLTLSLKATEQGSTMIMMSLEILATAFAYQKAVRLKQEPDPQGFVHAYETGLH